jgi:transglutaminase-like putative cysteine protease
MDETTMRLSIQHETRYDYSAPLRYALQSLCLTPQGSAHQTVHHWSLTAPGPLFARHDGYGNLAHTWSLATRERSGSVRAQGLVETHAEPCLTDRTVPPQVYLRPTPLTTPGAPLLEMARTVFADAATQAMDGPLALRLADEILRRVPYVPKRTTVLTTAAEALRLQGGVCQDHAHLFVAACRAQGLPARYVSGYFHAPDAAHLASHAWADVCIDVAQGRWLSVDVTHRCLMDDRHVRLAVGPDYAACPPVRGIREGGGDESMRVDIQIRQQPVQPPALAT